MGSWALKEATLSSLDLLVVVSRKDGYPDWLSSTDGGMDWENRCSFVTAIDADLGMAYSLRVGLSAAVAQNDPDAVVVLLADQPLIYAAMIERLIAEFAARRTLDYVASGDDGFAKPPMLLASSMFEAVMKLEGDEGARKLLHQPAFRGKVLEVADPARFVDLDTPQDVEGFMTDKYDNYKINS
jgi:molybdenum cofactor cytidylyltransferase